MQDHQFHHVFWMGDLNYRLDPSMDDGKDERPWPYTTCGLASSLWRPVALHVCAACHVTTGLKDRPWAEVRASHREGS